MTGVATSAGALALTLSIVTLFAGRIGTALRICMLQALAAGLAAGAQGWARHAASLCLAALPVVALNGLALPMALRRLVGAAATQPTIGWQRGFALSATAAFVLVAASVAGSMRLADGKQFELLALGMSIVLLGLLFLAVRSHRLLPVLGLLASQNGIVVAACAIPGRPMSVLLLAVVPLVPSLAVVSLWLHDRNRLAVAPPWD
jgi:hydrogenase-4 membrane subunit HyfE